MSLKQRAHRLIHSRHMLWGVGLASFLESLVVPIPLETVLIPAMQLNRQRLWALAGAALLGCVIGAGVGYGAGRFLFQAVGEFLINNFSSQGQYEEIQQQLNEHGFWFVLTIGVTPVPFQIAMLAAGAVSYSFPLFLLATAISRSIRYFGLALLVWFFGNKAMELMQRYKLAAAALITALVVLTWWLAYMLQG